MWACNESAPESTHTHFLAERASRMIRGFSAREEPWHIEVHFPEPHDAYTPLRRFLDNYRCGRHRTAGKLLQRHFENKPNLFARAKQACGRSWTRTTSSRVCAISSPTANRSIITPDVCCRPSTRVEADNTLVIFTSDHGDMVPGRTACTSMAGGPTRKRTASP